MKTLEISLETLFRLIEIKEEIKNKYPDREGFNKIDVDRLIAFSKEPLRRDFYQIINDLSQNQKRELSAIVWRGRGDFADFETAYEHAASFDGENTASYLEGKPLKKYIQQGISAVRSEGINIK